MKIDGELLWKWVMRFGGLFGVIFVTISYAGDVPAAAYAAFGGMMGFPSIADAVKASRNGRYSKNGNGRNGK